MKEFVVYTALRIGVFVATLAVVLGIWMFVADSVSILWPLVISLVLSGVASYFFLKRPREAFARRVEGRAARMQQKYDEMKSKEDVD